MNKLKFILLSLLLVAAGSLRAQNEGNSFSLQQAVDYAKKNNPTLKNAAIDVEIARKKVKETASMGIPSLSGTVDYTGQPQVPVTVVPNFISPNDPNAPKTLEFQMGIPHTLSAKLTANWLLLDGTYFLGLKAASEYVQMASLARANTEIETEVNVTKAYYLALIAGQSLTLIESNMNTLQKTTDDTKALYENGFAEKIDYQRLELQLSNLKTQKEKLINQRDISLRILKFQMGYDVVKDIVLTDSLQNLVEKVASLNTSGAVNPSARAEFKLLEQQQTLNQLNVRRHQVSYLPSLSTWAQHQQNSFAIKEQFGDLGNKFYAGTTWGLSLRVPIFNGFYKQSLIQQARLEMVKTKNEINQFQNVVQNEVFQAQRNYSTALQNLDVQKKNVELAHEIYNIAETKFKEGVGSSLEVSNANNDLKTAENNYVSAIYDLLVAELDYKKASGLIK